MPLSTHKLLNLLPSNKVWQKSPTWGTSQWFEGPCAIVGTTNHNSHIAFQPARPTLAGDCITNWPVWMFQKSGTEKQHFIWPGNTVPVMSGPLKQIVMWYKTFVISQRQEVKTQFNKDNKQRHCSEINIILKVSNIPENRGILDDSPWGLLPALCELFVSVNNIHQVSALTHTYTHMLYAAHIFCCAPRPLYWGMDDIWRWVPLQALSFDVPLASQ